MKNLYVFLAPPNGGKGTQTKRLSKELDWPVIDMGSTFRAMKNRTDDLAKRVTELFGDGNFVPNEVTFEVFVEELEKLPDADGYILDGFPRTLDQGLFLENLCKEKPYRIKQVFYLNTPLKVAEKRASGRLICSKNSDHIYNVYHQDFAPLSSPCGWLCPIDNGTLFTRSDDEPERVKARLDQYSQITFPLMAFYDTQNLLIEINGDQEPIEVTNQIKSRLIYEGQYHF